jgi:hypothetical protein
VARHRVLAISKTSAAVIPVTGAVASRRDLPIHLTDAAQAWFAANERAVVNGQYKLRQISKVTVTLPAPAAAKQARAS